MSTFSAAELYSKYDIEDPFNQKLQIMDKTISDTQIESIKNAFTIAYSLSKCSLKNTTPCKIFDEPITKEKIQTSINFLTSYIEKNQNEEFRKDLETILTYLKNNKSGGTRKKQKKTKTRRKQSRRRYYKKKSI